MTPRPKHRNHDSPPWLRGLPEGSPRRTLFFSIAAHGAILLALLKAPAPTFVKPSSVVAGRNGTAMTQVYWITERDDPSKDSGEGIPASSEPSRTPQRSKLEWLESHSVRTSSFAGSAAPVRSTHRRQPTAESDRPPSPFTSLV